MNHKYPYGKHKKRLLDRINELIFSRKRYWKTVRWLSKKFDSPSDYWKTYRGLENKNKRRK